MIITHGEWSAPDTWFVLIAAIAGLSIPAGSVLYAFVSPELAAVVWALGASAFLFLVAGLLGI